MLGSSIAALLFAGASFLDMAVLGEEVTCYAPDGKTIGDNETYVPCNKLGITQQGVYSSCCNLDDEKASDRDLCTTTGLCLKGGILLRGYCTDQSWESDACVKVCMDEAHGGSPNSTVQITPCTDGKYCCGKDNLSCCGTENAFEIPSLVNHTATETPVASNSDDDASTFKNATIGLAVVLGVVIIAAAGGLFYLIRKNKSLYSQLSQKPPAAPAMAETQGNTVNRDDIDPYLQSYTAGSTVASHSPYNEYSQNYKPGSIVPPSSPGPSEAPTHQRYSELDATVTSRTDNTSSYHADVSSHPAAVPENGGEQTYPPPLSPRLQQ